MSNLISIRVVYTRLDNHWSRFRRNSVDTNVQPTVLTFDSLSQQRKHPSLVDRQAGGRKYVTQARPRFGRPVRRIRVVCPQSGDVGTWLLTIAMRVWRGLLF